VIIEILGVELEVEPGTIFEANFGWNQTPVTLNL
jgi:hypothetical protein